MAEPTIPDTPVKELPLYVCHKEVRALKIARVEYTSMSDVQVFFEDGNYGFKDLSVANRPQPQPGWWYVEYENGYYSFSPDDAFTSGYSLKNA